MSIIIHSSSSNYCDQEKNIISSSIDLVCLFSNKITYLNTYCLFKLEIYLPFNWFTYFLSQDVNYIWLLVILAYGNDNLSWLFMLKNKQEKSI